MEAYLRTFINFKQNEWVRPLLIANLAYNNAKNACSGYTLFELNCSYHPQILYKDNIDLCSKFKSKNNLSAELRERMIVCQEDLYHAQKL